MNKHDLSIDSKEEKGVMSSRRVRSLYGLHNTETLQFKQLGTEVLNSEAQTTPVVTGRMIKSYTLPPSKKSVRADLECPSVHGKD